MEQTKLGRRWQSARYLVLMPALLLLVGWLLNTPPGLLGKADAIGYSVCHRIDLRSFHLSDRQLPLCARCTGMYLGAMVGLLFLGFTAPRRAELPRLRVLAVFGLMTLAFGIDGVNSYFHLFPGFTGIYEPQNWLRLFTGSGMGLVIAAVLYPVFNQTMWKMVDMRPAIDGWKSLAGLCLLTLGVDGLVLLEFPPLLLFFGLVSAAGVLVILTLVYGMMLTMAFRRENGFERPAQFILPLIAGFTVALAQVAGIDIVRFWLTGTWDGFHLG